MHYIFLDCSAALSVVGVFVKNSLIISAVGFFTVFILLLFFSGRIIRPIAETYEKQRQFITDAGHELKTPLTIIDADAELLEMDVPGNEWLTDIRCQTRRLSDLTHDLIFLSRMEEQISSRRIEFPLSDVVSECAASFQAVAKTQDKTFITSIEPMISFVGDENGILRLLSILLDNAIKYSSDGGTISLSLACQGKKVRMTVENSLDGMAPGTLENMFERFYRGDVSRSRQEGYGIGLAIAKAVVEAHRGKISAAVKEGKTMTVSVILPLQA